MKTKTLFCLVSIAGALIVKFIWFLTITFASGNTNPAKEAKIAEPIVEGSNIVISVFTILLFIFWLYPRVKKNLSNL